MESLRPRGAGAPSRNSRPASCGPRRRSSRRRRRWRLSRRRAAVAEARRRRCASGHGPHADPGVPERRGCGRPGLGASSWIRHRRLRRFTVAGTAVSQRGRSRQRRGRSTPDRVCSGAQLRPPRHGSSRRARRADPGDPTTRADLACRSGWVHLPRVRVLLCRHWLGGRLGGRGCRCRGAPTNRLRRRAEHPVTCGAERAGTARSTDPVGMRCVLHQRSHVQTLESAHDMLARFPRRACPPGSRRSAIRIERDRPAGPVHSAGASPHRGTIRHRWASRRVSRRVAAWSDPRARRAKAGCLAA